MGRVEKPRFGAYYLLQRIAQGGMAELFLAQPVDPARAKERVVIKRLLEELSEEQKFLQMFLEEARLASQLSHPNIVRVIDLGLEERHLYIAMEYIDGVDLYTATRRRRLLLAPHLAARIGAEVCMALAHAHQATDLKGQPLHVLHRDVTPENVMISRRGEVKLVDFGIAKAMSRVGLTRPGVIKGKLAYLSPEQVERKELDGRADLFTLGATLYEVTTGTKPFLRVDVSETLRAIVSEDPPEPHLWCPGFPEGLSAILMRALQRDRDLRFASAGEMNQALLRFLASSGKQADARDLAALTDFDPQKLPPEEPEQLLVGRAGPSPASRPRPPVAGLGPEPSTVSLRVPAANPAELLGDADSLATTLPATHPGAQLERLATTKECEAIGPPLLHRVAGPPVLAPSARPAGRSLTAQVIKYAALAAALAGAALIGRLSAPRQREPAPVIVPAKLVVAATPDAASEAAAPDASEPGADAGGTAQVP